MNAKVMSYEEVHNDWREVVGSVLSGGTVLVESTNKPVAAIIPFEDFLALKDQLESLREARAADGIKSDDADWERAAMEVLDEYDRAWRRLADL